MIFSAPIFAVCGCAALWLALGRPRWVPRAAAPSAANHISIIVPARNEQANLPALLQSIRDQNVMVHEVILVDDESEDGTAEVAKLYGATVLATPNRIGKWKGKTHACHTGAHHATGSWLLFLDADTRLEPGAMGRIAALTTDPRRVSSICPHHAVVRAYEEMSAFFNVVTIAAVDAFGFGRLKSPALFGQCLLISKDAYVQIGGHCTVREEILENFALARHLEAAGISRDCYLGRGCVTMRMFPNGLAELWNSWKKGFATGAMQTSPMPLILISTWLTGAMVATFALADAIQSGDRIYCISAGAAYALNAYTCHRAFRMAGNFSLLSALLFPVPLLFYQVLFFASLLERMLGIKPRWKGRHVD